MASGSEILRIERLEEIDVWQNVLIESMLDQLDGI